MPGATLPPRNTGTVGGAITRVERIERNTIAPPATQHVSMIFSYPGTLANNITSPPWYVPRSGLIDAVRVSLTSTASQNQTITVNVNGVSQGSFICGASTKSTVTTAAISVAYGDYVTITTSSVTDSNMSVELRLR